MEDAQYEFGFSGFNCEFVALRPRHAIFVYIGFSKRKCLVSKYSLASRKSPLLLTDLSAQCFLQILQLQIIEYAAYLNVELRLVISAVEPAGDRNDINPRDTFPKEVYRKYCLDYENNCFELLFKWNNMHQT